MLTFMSRTLRHAASAFFSASYVVCPPAPPAGGIGSSTQRKTSNMQVQERGRILLAAACIASRRPFACWSLSYASSLAELRAVAELSSGHKLAVANCIGVHPWDVNWKSCKIINFWGLNTPCELWDLAFSICWNIRCVTVMPDSTDVALVRLMLNAASWGETRHCTGSYTSTDPVWRLASIDVGNNSRHPMLEGDLLTTKRRHPRIAQAHLLEANGHLRPFPRLIYRENTHPQ